MQLYHFSFLDVFFKLIVSSCLIHSSAAAVRVLSALSQGEARLRLIHVKEDNTT